MRNRKQVVFIAALLIIAVATILTSTGSYWQDQMGAGDMTKATYDPANISEQLVGISAIQELDNKTLDASVGKGTWTASGTWTLPAVTAGGTVTLSDSVSILLDASPIADGESCGMKETGVAGAALAFGDLVYFSSADSRWELADANAEATTKPKLGICVQVAGGDGSATTILLYGKVRADAAFPAMTIGGPVFADTTAGDVTMTAPSGVGDCIRVVGNANTADELMFAPDGIWIEHK
jgi:hypothetical protein